MKAACSDILTAYAFGAAFEALFQDLEEDMVVPTYPQLLSFQQPEPTPATPTTTVQLPIHLEPPPPTCSRSAYSCCCGMGEAEANGDGGCARSGESELDACSASTWGTIEDVRMNGSVDRCQQRCCRLTEKSSFASQHATPKCLNNFHVLNRGMH